MPTADRQRMCVSANSLINKRVVLRAMINEDGVEADAREGAYPKRKGHEYQG